VSLRILIFLKNNLTKSSSSLNVQAASKVAFQFTLPWLAAPYLAIRSTQIFQCTDKLTHFILGPHLNSDIQVTSSPFSDIQITESMAR
jgi:hypothetical protein